MISLKVFVITTSFMGLMLVESFFKKRTNFYSMTRNMTDATKIMG